MSDQVQISVDKLVKLAKISYKLEHSNSIEKFIEMGSEEAYIDHFLFDKEDYKLAHLYRSQLLTDHINQLPSQVVRELLIHKCLGLSNYSNKYELERKHNVWSYNWEEQASIKLIKTWTLDKINLYINKLEEFIKGEIICYWHDWYPNAHELKQYI